MNDALAVLQIHSTSLLAPQQLPKDLPPHTSRLDGQARAQMYVVKRDGHKQERRMFFCLWYWTNKVKCCIFVWAECGWDGYFHVCSIVFDFDAIWGQCLLAKS